MRVETVATPPAEVEADALAFAVAEEAGLPAVVSELGDSVAARLTGMLEDREICGCPGELTVLHTEEQIAPRRVVAIGLGKRDDVGSDAVGAAAANVARRFGRVGAGTIAWLLDADGLPPEEQARAIVDGSILGPFDHGRWRSKREESQPKRLLLCGPQADRADEAARIAAVVATWTNRCRELVDAPANELTPEALAEVARTIAGESASLSCEVLDEDAIEVRGMGLLAAVGRGSTAPSRLIVLRYDPEAAGNDLVLGLVGKAVTFDSGGLSLKPAARMEDMKSDMAGGAAVLAALGAIAELELPVRIVAVVAACENMVSGSSVRPGDIVTALNGTTVEITNTDAEGRLALADALVYARELGATHMLDLATLTGGMTVAMGDVYAGLFANQDGWGGRVRAAGEASGDLVWPWPLHPSYDRYTESAFADLKNSSLFRQGTPAYAARFLQRFAGDGPWAHVDMAGTGYLDRGRDDVYSTAGATGFGVRLAVELAQGLSA